MQQQPTASTPNPVELVPLPRKGDRLRGAGHTFWRERIAAGEVEAVKLGRSLRIVVSSLDAYLSRAPKATLRPSRRNT